MRALAERTSRELLACAGKLDQSVALLEGAVDREFFQSYRELVGQVMGLFYIEILRDVFKQYPDLEPESMK